MSNGETPLSKDFHRINLSLASKDELVARVTALENLEHEVTESMVAAGERMASDLTNAQVSKQMGGLGGSKTWDEWLGTTVPNRDLILSHLNEEIVSVTAIFLAMARAK